METELFHCLSNGIPVLGALHRARRSVAIGAFVNAGAAAELPHERGVAHFIEHMVFKGSRECGPIELAERFAKIGAQVNAYTSESTTGYYGTALAQFGLELLDVFGTLFRPAFEESQIELERSVILEEFALYRERPENWFMEEAVAHYFQGHPEGYQVLGTEATVGALGRDALFRFFSEQYCADQLVITVAGNFDWQKVLEGCERHFGHLGPKAVRRDRPLPETAAVGKEFFSEDVNQSRVLVAFPAPSYGAPESVAFDLLGSMLAGGSSSRLFWALEHPGLVEEVSFDYEARRQLGVAFAYAVTTGRLFSKVRTLLLRALEKALSCTAAEFRAAKEKVKAEAIIEGELPLGRVMDLGEHFLLKGERYSLEGFCREVDAVKPEDVVRCAETFLAPGKGVEYHLRRGKSSRRRRTNETSV